MILERKIYKKLVAWKEETQGKKAILLEGARRIGKSTIAEEFAKKEYKSHLLIDFSKVPEEVKQCFSHLNNLDDFYMLLTSIYGVTLYIRESLVIFDEVQLFPQARSAIKHLVADGRYDFLETGSLISIRENVAGILIPSEERHLKMYPLDFEEFCWALGEKPVLSYIRDCFEKKVPLERGLHEKAMLLFRQYLLIGGMPMSVIAFLENHKDFGKSDLEKRDILDLYRTDIMKIQGKYRSKVLSIFDRIPGLLSSHEKRVILSDIADGSSADQYTDTFFWLSESMIANECRRVNDPEVGLSLTESETYIKSYMADTGLLVSHAFDENELLENEVYRQIIHGKLNFNEGMLFENMIAQMLTANGHRLFFYTHYDSQKKRNDMEIDFIISNNSKLKYKIFPIEVKSGERYSTKSLERFKEKYKERIGCCYIIHPKNLVLKDDILCIPPYMTICL
ncbi:MAG: AAA family ATPase [Treponema sp.]|nr:AAA family ATPase [Spirochaetia bacterium]MDD7460713.1 AAA family ATPase [Spirochaetales bacterium]MDY5812285.1 AAA family ATPase [Treponema sp.]MEE1181640.1 AAA family ATPase [Treponema sp.]